LYFDVGRIYSEVSFALVPQLPQHGSAKKGAL